MAVIESVSQDDKTLLYRRVFGTPDGKAVLADMVFDLGVFDSIPPGEDGAERQALRNYGVSLLYNLGVLVDKNVPTIVDKLMELGYTKIERKE